jgi:hypothetical protein
VIRAIVWGLAALGLFVSGLAFAVLAVGLIEGWRATPDWLSELIAVTIAATASWTAGVLCTRAPGRWVALSVAMVPAGFLATGLMVAERTESNAHGLSLQAVAEIVAVAAALVGGAAFVARRTAPAT